VCTASVATDNRTLPGEAGRATNLLRAWETYPGIPRRSCSSHLPPTDDDTKSRCQSPQASKPRGCCTRLRAGPLPVQSWLPEANRPMAARGCPAWS